MDDRQKEPTEPEEGPLGRALREGWEEREAAEPATTGYTEKPCQHCGRIRVYLRRDGRLICEKCEAFQKPETP